MPWIDALLATAAVALALAMRPWRSLGPMGPPWPWMAWCVALPLLWSADRLAQAPLALALPGSCLLMLMAGWPLAMLALLAVAASTALLAGLTPPEALHRLVWLGVAPATVALLLGGAIRRWLPGHLFVYILGRGFFATAAANLAAGAVDTLLFGPLGPSLPSDELIARGLVAFGDAFLCGMIVAIFVAFRPQWLATYADRLYLPRT